MSLMRAIGAFIASQLIAVSLAGAVGVPIAKKTPSFGAQLWGDIKTNMANALQQAASAPCTPTALRSAYDRKAAPRLIDCRYDLVRGPFETFFKPGGPPAQRPDGRPIGTIIDQSIAAGAPFAGPGTLTVTISSGPSPQPIETTTSVVTACPPSCPTPRPTKSAKPRCRPDDRYPCPDPTPTLQTPPVIKPTPMAGQSWNELLEQPQALLLLLLVPLAVVAWFPIRRGWRYLFPAPPLPAFSCAFASRRENLATDHAPLIVGPTFSIGLGWHAETSSVDRLKILSERTA